MKSKISSLVFLLIICLPVYSQTSFFTKDSVTKFNLKVLDNGGANFKYCNVIVGGKSTRFSPYEVSEYGLSNGIRFESREIRIEDEMMNVFMERLVKGKTNLYYFRGYGLNTFYIEKEDEGLVELPRKSKENGKTSYKERLVRLNPDCSADFKTTRNIRYTRAYLQRYVEMNNDCGFSRLPGIGIGIIGGIGNFRFNTTRIGFNDVLADIRFRSSDISTIGIFLEYPLRVSNLALYTDIHYYSHVASFEKASPASSAFISFIHKGLSIPFMLKVSYPRNSERLYIKFGPMFSFTTHSQDILATNSSEEIDESPLVSSRHIGLSGAAGLNVFMGSLGTANVEMRYVMDIDAGKAESLLKRGGFYLLLGYKPW